MLRSPNNYSPFTHPELAMQRRTTVLGLMLNQKKISRDEYDKAMATKLPPRPFRQRSGLSSIPFYVDRVLEEIASDYGIKNVKGRGLQIYTAIDLNAQDTAARTIEAGLSALEDGCWRVRRPEARIESVANRSVYATVFEPRLSSQNITPATLVSDTRFVYKRQFSEDWSPRNYEDVYHQTVTVAQALEQSLNSASVRIGLACGLDPIVQTPHTLALTSDIDSRNPSFLLGAIDVTPIEMADAYATIARVGSRVPLHTVKFVTDD